MGEKFCPFGVPSSGNYWKPFVEIFGFFLFQKRRKVPMKRERKKANDLRKREKWVVSGPKKSIRRQ
jgi:hypothetical protein